MDNLERYKRNIDLKELGVEGQNKLLGAKVLVAGAGGLGSSVISNLACLGVGMLGIVDFDRLEQSNFNRQYIYKSDELGKEKVFLAKKWVESYNPDIKVRAYNLKLDETNYKEILNDYDIVIDCFDSFESKFLLNKACVRAEKILIHGGVQEFMGQVMTVIPHKSACLACVFDEYEPNLPPKGILSPIINVIGSIQALEAVKIILGKENLLTNTILSYDCMEHKLKKLIIQQNADCSTC